MHAFAFAPVWILSSGVAGSGTQFHAARLMFLLKDASHAVPLGQVRSALGESRHVANTLMANLTSSTKGPHFLWHSQTVGGAVGHIRTPTQCRIAFILCVFLRF